MATCETCRWFAWHPIRFHSGEWTWLRSVYRYPRDNGSRYSETHRSWWEYHPRALHQPKENTDA